MKKVYCDLCGKEIRPSDDEIERIYKGGIPHFDGTWTKLVLTTKFATLFNIKDRTIPQDICWSCCWRILRLLTLLKKRDSNLIKKFDKLLQEAKINSFKTVDQEDSVFN